MKTIKKIIDWIISLFTVTKQEKQKTVNKYPLKAVKSKKELFAEQRYNFLCKAGLTPKKPKKRIDNITKKEPVVKEISDELKELREIRNKKRMFFINLITSRARQIQIPYILEKRKKKLQRQQKMSTFQL